jgi:hypothetical protein
MPDAQAEQFSRIQGLFRNEMEPVATGQNFWIAFKNQCLISSGVSSLPLYRCCITPVHTILQGDCFAVSPSRIKRMWLSELIVC